MRIPVTLALLALISVAGLLGGAGARSAGAQETVEVAVGDFFFCDPSLPPGACQTVVSAGDTVVWNYSTGSEGHTVTDCGESCDAPTSTPLWDSGGLTAGQSFSYTFNEPGTHQYLCLFHPDAMRAVVLVEAAQPAASPTPSPSSEGSPIPTPGQPAPSPSPLPTISEGSPTAAPPQATPSPTSEPSVTPAPSPSDQDDDGGISSWALISVGLAGGLVLLGAGVIALRRFR